jgi:hypothetical protein
LRLLDMLQSEERWPEKGCALYHVKRACIHQSLVPFKPMCVLRQASWICASQRAVGRSRGRARAEAPS